jgi:hypothetical protein
MTDDLTIISRVASRFKEAIVFPRDTYVPKEHRSEKPLTPEGTDLVIWTWDEPMKGFPDIPYGVAFAGKANATPVELPIQKRATTSAPD